VPNPSFTLVQHYETKRLKMAHCDLYRIEDPPEVGREDALHQGALDVLRTGPCRILLCATGDIDGRSTYALHENRGCRNQSVAFRDGAALRREAERVQVAGSLCI